MTISLPPDEVHLWTVEISTNWNEALHRAASIDEHHRASRFRDPSDGERYLSAHGALRLTLADYLSCRPHDLAFRQGEWGKPFLDRTDLQFNLSHSAAMVLIAVARGRAVGVDVERIRSIPDQEAVLARVATTEECAAFARVAARDRDATFFCIWTRMEALCKTTGAGIGAGSSICRESMARCRLVQVRDLDGYAACVAAEGFDWRLVRMARPRESTP